MATRPDTYLELSFSPNVKLVSSVRRFVMKVYAEVLDDDATHRIGVATHELLENAVKFAADASTRIRITVAEDDAAVVHITTWNRASDEAISAVNDIFAEIYAATDYDDFYQRLMHRTPDSADMSGLGLGRILAETGTTLKHAVADGMVKIEAWVPMDFDQGGN